GRTARGKAAQHGNDDQVRRAAGLLGRQRRTEARPRMGARRRSVQRSPRTDARRAPRYPGRTRAVARGLCGSFSRRGAARPRPRPHPLLLKAGGRPRHLSLRMQFDTKIAVVLRDDLAGWQKTNVTAFLVSGIAATVPGVVGEPYRDASENEYLPMF